MREAMARLAGRKIWLCREERGGRRAAALYTLIATAKVNDVEAWLADVLVRLPDYPARRIGDLLAWNWHAECQTAAGDQPKNEKKC